jgi:hypothetical protein
MDEHYNEHSDGSMFPLSLDLYETIMTDQTTQVPQPNLIERRWARQPLHYRVQALSRP